MKGFNLIELMVVMSIIAILAMVAMPSFIHHNNLLVLQSAVTNFKWGYITCTTNQTLNGGPACIIDPSWSVNGFSYYQTFPKISNGVLTVTPPAKVGGAWGCTYSIQSYNFLRC